MANSATRSGASRSSDRTEHRQKGGNRARDRLVNRGVLSGRVKKKHQQKASNRVTEELYETTERDEASPELPANESNDTDEEDAYEDDRTDKDCSEGSGYVTEKNTSTRVAIERCQESRKELRAKITTRPLARTKDLVLLSPHPSATTTTNTTAHNQREFIKSINLLPLRVRFGGVNLLQANSHPAHMVLPLSGAVRLAPGAVCLISAVARPRLAFAHQ